MCQTAPPECAFALLFAKGSNVFFVVFVFPAEKNDAGVRPRAAMCVCGFTRSKKARNLKIIDARRPVSTNQALNLCYDGNRLIPPLQKCHRASKIYSSAKSNLHIYTQPPFRPIKNLLPVFFN